MTPNNIIALALCGVFFIVALIFLIVFLGKKYNFIPRVVAGIFAVIGLTGCIMSAVNILNVYKLNDRQNYVACELVELGNYSTGRDMAEISYSRLENRTSARIIVLSIGLSGKDSLCVQANNAYLQKYAGDPMLTFIADLNNQSVPADDRDAYNDELYKMLDEVKKSIGVDDEKDCQKTAEAFDILDDEAGDIEEAEDIIGKLDENDVLTMQLSARVAAANGDYDEAYEHMENAVKKDDVFSNKLALASLAACGYSESKSTMKDYQKKVQKMNDELQEYEYSYSNAYDDDEREEYQDKIDNVKKDLASLREETFSDNINSAINYILSSWLTNRDTVEYEAILSELYYLLGDDELANEYAEKMYAVDPTTQFDERMAVDVYDMVNTYDSFNYVEPEDGEQSAVDILVNKIHGGIEIPVLDDGDDSYAAFLEDMVGDIANAVYISNVTTVDLENFEVSVNISRNDTNIEYTKEDFRLFDMGVEVTDFEVVTSVSTNTSVCLVVDHSGSMGGTPLDDAKHAVKSFAQNVSEGVSIGLAVFDDRAELLCNVTKSTGALSKTMDDVSSGGGTNIAGGLDAGREALAGKSGKRIIILLSDGQDSSYIDETIANLKNDGIIVYCIGFGDVNPDYLNGIAEQTGGKFLMSDSSADLLEMYNTINKFIGNDYTFRFKTVSPSTALQRTVRIVMSDGFSDEITYVVGPQENGIVDAAPSSDFYVQNGGSNKNKEDDYE